MQVPQLNVWKKHNKRAPHKPLLLLYALGQWQHGKREFAWADVKVAVKDLIEQFGGPASKNPQYPFIRLQNDNIWEVDNVVKNRNGDMNVSLLDKYNNHARFTSDFESQLHKPEQFQGIVQQLLDEHFSETMHEDLLDAVGIESPEVVKVYQRRKRNPEFRQAVLDAYRHECAICGYQLRYRSTLIGVEAAHIQWHNANGPDSVENGVALCAIHHKLLDYGAIGFDQDLQLLVASGVNGKDLGHWLYDHEGRSIALPSNGVNEPRPEYITWQRKEVFRG